MSVAEATTVESLALPITVKFAFVKALATELSEGQVKLPSVPEVVIQLQKSLSDEWVSNETVVQLIGSEPKFAARLMTMANSVALNASARQIIDLRSAVARVGFNIVRSVALSFAVEHLRKAVEFQHLVPQLDELWKDSVQTATLCHVIARRFTSLNGDTALLAGLVHNVGRIYILTRASKFPALADEPLTYQSIVRDWHANVAKALLENWRVSDEIVDAVDGCEGLGREARGPVALTDILSLAMHVKDIRNGRAMATPGEPLLKGLKRMQLQLSDCHSVIDGSAEEIAALTGSLGG